MADLQIFQIDASVASAQHFDARLTVNEAAPIFAEHFPDYPIVPALASLASSVTASHG